MSDQQSRQGKDRAAKAPKAASESGAQWPPDQLPNPTANTSLTSPGPPPESAVAGAPPSQPARGRQSRGTRRQGNRWPRRGQARHCSPAT